MTRLRSGGRGAASEPLLSEFRRSAKVAGILRLASVGLAFVFFVVLARTMTPEVFGVFSSAYSLGLILSYVATLGQHVAIQRFWPSLDETYGPGAAGAALRRGLLLTILGGGVGLLLLAALGQNRAVATAFGASPTTLAWTGAYVLIAAISDYASSALRARGALLLALVPRDLAWRIVAIAVLLLQSPEVGADLALAVVSLTLLFVCLPQLAVVAADLWRFRHERLPAVEQTKMLNATWALWAVTSVNPIATHAATVLVALALGPVAAGAFFAADRLAKLLAIALEGMERISGPLLARSYHASRMDEVQHIIASTSAIAFSAAMIGALAYVALGHLALALFDQSYVSAYPVLLILVAGQLVNSACGSNATLLNMAGRERDLLAIRIVWAALSLPATYLAASSFGLVGAALASACAISGWNLTAVLVCKARFGFWTVSIDTLFGGTRSLFSRLRARR